MKQLKNYLSIISMLVLLFALMFTSCSNDKEEDIICKVSVISGEGGTATASENEVVSGWKVTLTAIPNKDYHFVNWTVNGVEVSKENPYTTTITQNTQFIANFREIYKPTGSENGYNYVDLGLSVKWATCNVGATTPEGYGDYFAWGETEPKYYYDWSTYKYCNGSWNTMTKYCVDSYHGTVDNKTTLELTDDAARVNWGGNWRMPTIAEYDELKSTSNCTWTWTTQNGVNGYKVTSKKNGNSIFLPVAGRWSFYWSSSLDTDYNSDCAFGLQLNSDDVYWYGGSRYHGQSVRAVCE